MSALEREYAAWLGAVEREAVLPLKVLLAGLSAAYWMGVRSWAPPDPAVFGIFITFAFVTAGEYYFFLRDRITPRQVKSFIYGSFLLDAGFVAALVLLDVSERAAFSEFFLLFVLLIFRGFALFRTQRENILGFLIVSIPFLAAGNLLVRSAGINESIGIVGQLGFLWGGMLISQGFVGLVNRRREEELRAREREIRLSSLASLGDLAAGVAHEINNPIGIIKTYSDFLMQSTAPDDPLREDFQAIRDEAQRCQEIVRRMLDFSNPQLEGFTELSLETLAEEVCQFVFHEGHEEGVRFTIQRYGEIPAVRGDPVQLKQALINILLNARQILGEKKQSSSADFHAQVTIVLSRGTGPRAPVRLIARDNGPGVSREDAERMFEPFTTRRAKGTGLGLAITRRIVDAHGGTIRMRPAENGGAEVILELPMAGEEAP